MKQKIRITCCIIMCLVLTLFISCKRDTYTINYSVKFDKIDCFGYKINDDSLEKEYFNNAIFSSREELVKGCIEWNNMTFDEKSEQYNNDLQQKLRSYNDSFFDKKSIIVITSLVNGNQKIKIKSVKVDKETIVVSAVVKDQSKLFMSCTSIEEETNADTRFWTTIIEINKQDIKVYHDKDSFEQITYINNLVVNFE